VTTRGDPSAVPPPNRRGNGDRDGGASDETIVALVRRAQAGDRTALNAVAQWLYPVVDEALRWRARRLPPADREDLTQAAVARAAERLARCDAADVHGVRAWARAVAWRLYLEDWRTGASAVARRSVPLYPDDTAADPRGATGWVGRGDERNAGSAFGARGATEARIDDEGPVAALARAAVDALDQLPRPVGLLFWMRLIEEASWSEIAAAFGTTTAAVKRRFQRAQATLRRRLTRGARASSAEPSEAAQEEAGPQTERRPPGGS
jgi:RNA polymerase sigma factor (sigma-70 family)